MKCERKSDEKRPRSQFSFRRLGELSLLFLLGLGQLIRDDSFVSQRNVALPLSHFLSALFTAAAGLAA